MWNGFPIYRSELLTPSRYMLGRMNEVTEMRQR